MTKDRFDEGFWAGFIIAAIICFFVALYITNNGIASIEQKEFRGIIDETCQQKGMEGVNLMTVFPDSERYYCIDRHNEIHEFRLEGGEVR